MFSQHIGALSSGEWPIPKHEKSPGHSEARETLLKRSLMLRFQISIFVHYCQSKIW